jgi:hypothetical protein
MEESQPSIQGLQLCARYYEDIQREWNLCRTHSSTLEILSVSDGALIYCMEKPLQFPLLKTLQVFIRGEVAMHPNRRPLADWRLVEDSIRRIKSWMSLHSFPSLEQLDILWANDVLLQSWVFEEIYTEDGPETIREQEFDYAYINMDAVFNHYGIYEKPLDIQWMEAFPIRTLNVSKALYDFIKSDNTFQVISGPDFTQKDVEKMLESLHDC